MRFEERKLFFEDMGDIAFIKNTRARRLVIRINSYGQIKVTVPYLVSYRNATNFVEKKRDWIIRVQNDLKKTLREKTVFKENTDFNTVFHTIRVARHSGEKLKKIKSGEVISILVPSDALIETGIVQGQIRKCVTEIWRDEAKSILPGIVDELALRYGFHYDKVKIKNMRTRWGSCSGKNSINLNLHLVRMPDYLRDYIILHELVHTVHKNHGKEFWKTLTDLSGDARKLAKELKGSYIEMW